MLVNGRGRRQRRSQRREGEASPPSFERFSIIIQHALLPLDEVRRIYVAFGEHPAAGGLYMFFYVFVALCKALWCLFSALGGLLAPLWSPWARLGHCLVGFGWHVGFTVLDRVLE